MDQEDDLGYFYNYPIDINIRIRPMIGSTREVEVRVSGMPTMSFNIGLTQGDVDSINLELQQAIEKVANKCGRDGVARKDLQPLITAGRSGFNRIFKGDLPKEIINRALNAVRTKPYPTIEIASEDFLIPWEMLYIDTDPVDEQALWHFWGMKYTISRTIVIPNARPSNMVSPIIWSACPQVGLVAYHTLKHVKRKEIPLLVELHKQKRISLTSLRELQTRQRKEDLKHLGLFLGSEELQLLHIACHAQERKPIGLSFLVVSKDFPISMQELTSENFCIKHALVILNACRTGTISPLYTFNWANIFWENGARGILATEFHVPDWFAANFVEQLYKYLLPSPENGERNPKSLPIGECLRIVRHYFGKQNNPLGLAYALYSPLAVIIAAPSSSSIN